MNFKGIYFHDRPAEVHPIPVTLRVFTFMYPDVRSPAPDATGRFTVFTFMLTLAEASAFMMILI